jgi:hypothetical protein
MPVLRHESTITTYHSGTCYRTSAHSACCPARLQVVFPECSSDWINYSWISQMLLHPTDRKREHSTSLVPTAKNSTSSSKILQPTLVCSCRLWSVDRGRELLWLQHGPPYQRGGSCEVTVGVQRNLSSHTRLQRCHV